MSDLSKEVVIERFCRLATHLNNKLNGMSKPSDCFCNVGFHCDLEDYHFDSSILEYIENAVQESAGDLEI